MIGVVVWSEKRGGEGLGCTVGACVCMRFNKRNGERNCAIRVVPGCGGVLGLVWREDTVLGMFEK